MKSTQTWTHNRKSTKQFKK